LIQKISTEKEKPNTITNPTTHIQQEGRAESNPSLNSENQKTNGRNS